MSTAQQTTFNRFPADAALHSDRMVQVERDLDRMQFWRDKVTLTEMNGQRCADRQVSRLLAGYFYGERMQ